MTDDIMNKLDELQSICDAATKGPWDWIPYGLNEARTLAHQQPNIHDMNILKTTDDWPPTNADEMFISSARTAMPKMIAALKEIANYASQHPCYCLKDGRPDPEGCYCSGDGHGPTSCADCLTYELNEIITKALGVNNE